MWQALKEVWRNPYVRVAVGLIVAYLLYRFLYWSRAVWGSILIAYLIAFLLHPIVAWTERRTTRALGLLVVVLLLGGILTGLWFLALQIADQLSDVMEDLQW